MNVWNNYNKKTCVDFIENKFCHFFSMSNTLRHYIKHRHEKEVKRLFKPNKNELFEGSLSI